MDSMVEMLEGMWIWSEKQNSRTHQEQGLPTRVKAVNTVLPQVVPTQTVRDAQSQAVRLQRQAPLRC
jgi:hypothetical protein